MTSPTGRRRKAEEPVDDRYMVPLPTALVQFMARVETKLDAALTGQEDHEKRIRALEANRWPLPSLAALFGLASLVVAIFALAHS